MDTALLFITLVSLVTALIAFLSVWRMKRADQERSDARVAALAAAAGESSSIGHRPMAAEVRLKPETIVTVKPAAAFANASLFSSVASDFSRTRDDRPSSDFERETIDDRLSPIDDGRFFGTVQRETAPSGPFAFVAAAALLVALGGAVVVFTTSGNGGKAGVSAAQAARKEPLELVSLGHSREDSTLTISGVVRNPAGGLKLEGLTAVVSLIDNHGGLISTKDVPLDYRALGPGEEAPFKMTVPDQGSIARYRVSFRAGTDVVPHVDRRSDTKLASAL